jgi:hypothetical protein
MCPVNVKKYGYQTGHEVYWTQSPRFLVLYSVMGGNYHRGPGWIKY